MKKINPKITALVMALLSLLIAGGIVADEVIGSPTVDSGNSDDTGIW